MSDVRIELQRARDAAYRAEQALKVNDDPDWSDVGEMIAFIGSLDDE